MQLTLFWSVDKSILFLKYKYVRNKCKKKILIMLMQL